MYQYVAYKEFVHNGDCMRNNNAAGLVLNRYWLVDEESHKNTVDIEH